VIKIKTPVSFRLTVPLKSREKYIQLGELLLVEGKAPASLVSGREIVADSFLLEIWF
jgi:hypothetical protein